MDKDNFYIYAYLDPRKCGDYTYNNINFIYEPFYIGKGSGYRLNAHLNKAKRNKKNTPILNKIRRIILENLSPSIEVVKYFKTEEEAYSYEEYLIDLIGRKDLNRGPLLNLKDGGGVGSNVSEETKKLIGSYHKGKKLSDNHINAIKMSNIGNTHNLGRKHSKEINKKKGKANSSNNNAKLTEVDVLYIREKYFDGEMIQTELAQKFKVSQSTINRITTNKNWNNLI